MKIHYFGCDSRFDVCSNYFVDHHRYAKAGSISMRPAHRFKNLPGLQKRDILEVFHRDQWRNAKVIAFDGRSGQIHVRVSILCL